MDLTKEQIAIIYDALKVHNLELQHENKNIKPDSEERIKNGKRMADIFDLHILLKDKEKD